MPKLAKATSPNDGRVAEAVALLVKCPALTLEQVMLAVRFTAADAANRAKQAWIRRRAPLKKELRTPTSIQLTSSDTAGSTLTVSTLKHAPPPTKPTHHPIPQPKMKRKSITAAQSARADAKRLAEHKKEADCCTER
jgi:hypothetical protein